ncbi:heat stress transcription factor c-1 [Phtheirospermum japonicum]|uniref:Heat stress transcription factor c-1 n=1 Tax=Phtheirospermum japonicum TaxID=374723 RepID=A0A830C7B5_9LAMI|nr:heat stress transcription factor c-1 [Phtheirospermum japonicum]
MKTYQMVSDPATNGLIAWGRDNNSFIVLEPLEFSKRILPVYFKHHNFSSFVRQLNTYGFRKVDPDRWEFANEWFLRGQTQLLHNIMRKKHTTKSHTSHLMKYEDDGDDELITEIAKLKQEQKSLERELENMTRRLEATERRPQQMMTFLCKAVEDPDILPRMMLEKEKSKRLTSCGDKKRKFVVSVDSSSNSLSSEEIGVSTPISSSDGNLDVDAYCQSSPTVEISSPEWWMSRNNGGDLGLPMTIRQENANYVDLSSSASWPSCGGVGGGSMAVGPPVNSENANGFETNYFEGFEGGESASLAPPYPFSLLGGGF